jgi:para-nitrobenzyl esterase
MVWIHGGGNTIGAGTRYDGGHLAASQNVVVVTVNYRLGPFGWFRNAAIRTDANTDAERSGNFAILDLVRALEWVEGNIANFGGDPAHVTIFGESAGGSNALGLLLSPSAVGLFHRAIAQSAGFRTWDPVTAEAFDDQPNVETKNSSSEAIARLFVKDGTARDRDDAKKQLNAMPKADLATKLRAKTGREILAAYEPTPGLGMISMPTLMRDDTVLPTGDYLELFREKDRWSQVPVMLGTNRDEMKLFMAMNPEFTRRWAVLPYLRDAEQYERVARYQSTAWKASGADELASAMTAWGGPAWVYRFDWDEEPKILWSDLGTNIGAAHGLEIPFVFGHWDLGRAARVLFSDGNMAGREALAKQVMSYWAEFAYAGDPGRGRGGALPEWQGFREAAADSGHFLVLDTEAGGGLRMSDETMRTQDIVDRILADASFRDEAERCKLLGDIAQRSPSWREASYGAVVACQPYPVAAR